MTDNKTADDWLALLAIGEPEDADLAAFRQWHDSSTQHARAFQQAAWIWQSAGEAFTEIGRDVTPARIRYITRRLALGALAASAAGALVWHPPFGLWPSASALTADVRTGAGEQRTIVLSAGVSARLNTRTSLDIAAISPGQVRVTLLEGEVLFDTGGEAIVVTINDLSARAHAARFNVYGVGEEARVFCLAGDVFISGGNMEQKLAPGEQYILRDGIGEVGEAAPAALSWTQGRLVFRNEALSQVIYEINRYRAGRIFIMRDALKSKRVTADFTVQEIDSILPFLERVYGASVTRLPAGVVLVS
jgi:transmembrane sensor